VFTTSGTYPWSFVTKIFHSVNQVMVTTVKFLKWWLQLYQNMCTCIETKRSLTSFTNCALLLRQIVTKKIRNWDTFLNKWFIPTCNTRGSLV